MEKVSVSKGLMIGLAAIAAMSLLALAFVLGRASGPGGLSQQPSGREFPVGIAASPVSKPRVLEQPAQQTPQAPESTPAATSFPDPADARLAPGPAAAPSAGEPKREAPDPERAAVAAYLDAVDQIQPGKMSGNAEGTAQEMAAALAKGDTSDLDRMIRETEAAKRTLASLSPPATCAAHHRESLGSLDDALEMLRCLKTAMSSSDPAAGLAGVASRAEALRTRSEALQTEESALRQRYGLTR